MAMSSLRITTVATTAFGAAAIGLAVVATAGAASASSADDVFISQITNLGITFPSVQVAVQQGHQVCRELAQGKRGVDIADEILGQTNLDGQQAAYLIVDATKAYCPQYASQLTA